jgi:hypothetical protein
MANGIYRPKYRDRVTGEQKVAKVWWLSADPLTGKRRSTGTTNREAALAMLADLRRLAGFGARGVDTLKGDLLDLLFSPEKAGDMPVCYFVGEEDGDAIKIGFTTDLKRRLEEFRHYSPAPIVVRGLLFGSLAIERRLHAEFSAYRMHGSWYRREGDLAEFLNEIEFARWFGLEAA